MVNVFRMLEQLPVAWLVALSCVIGSSSALAAPRPIWQVSSTTEIIAIAAANSALFTLSRTGVLEQRDVRSGRVMQTRALGGARRWVGLELHDNLILARFESSTAAGLVALEPSRVRVLWAWWAPPRTRNLGSTRVIGAARGVVVWAEIVSGAYIANELYGIDTRTGQQRWTDTGVDVFGISGASLELSNMPLGNPQVLFLKRINLEQGTVTTLEINPPRRPRCAQNEIVGVNGPLGIAGGRFWAVAQDGCGAFAFGVRPNSTDAPILYNLPSGLGVNDPVPYVVSTNDAARAYWLEGGIFSARRNLVGLNLLSGVRCSFGMVNSIIPQIKRFGSRLLVVDDATVRIFDVSSGKRIHSLEIRAVDATVTAGFLIVLTGERLSTYPL